MPYKIVESDGGYDVVSKDTDRVVAHHAPPNAKEKAEEQVHLLEAVENDPNWEPTHGTE
jgi:hypothetical protein